MIIFFVLFHATLRISVVGLKIKNEFFTSPPLPWISFWKYAPTNPLERISQLNGARAMLNIKRYIKTNFKDTNVHDQNTTYIYFDRMF